MFEIESIAVLKREVFGPILHVVRYAGERLGESVTRSTRPATDSPWAFTAGSRKPHAFVRAQVHAGNTYVNRNQIGAVVGVQPFGGEGLSGTGPKAGGPHYLQRFALERTFTVNTTAAGGNAALLSSEMDGI